MMQHWEYDLSSLQRQYRDDPLGEWKIAMFQKMRDAGRTVWSYAPKDHPYIEYHPTSPLRLQRRAAGGLSKKQRERAVARAYKHQTLESWCPYWMIAAMFPDRDYGDPPSLKNFTRTLLTYVVTAYRYEDPLNEPAALDALARVGGTEAIRRHLYAWYQRQVASRPPIPPLTVLATRKMKRWC